MKLITVQFEGNDYISTITKATTKFEHEMLKCLKYDLFDPEDQSMSPWHMERIGDEHKTIKLANALGWSNVSYNGDDLYPEYWDEEGNCNYITAIPSNIETILAGYRLLGRHRKVAMILKKIEKLGIQWSVFNMEPGRQA